MYNSVAQHQHQHQQQLLLQAAAAQAQGEAGGSAVFFNIAGDSNNNNNNYHHGSSAEGEMTAMMNMLLCQPTSTSTNANGGAATTTTMATAAAPGGAELGNLRKRLFAQMEDIAPLPFVVEEDEREASRGILEETDSFLDLLPNAAETGVSSFLTSSSASSPAGGQRLFLFPQMPQVVNQQQKVEFCWNAPFPTGSAPFVMEQQQQMQQHQQQQMQQRMQQMMGTMPAPIPLSQQEAKVAFKNSKVTPPRRKQELSEKVKSVGQKTFKSFVVKKWTEEEDELLRKAVELHVSKNWKMIAKSVPGRNEQQCIQRWKNVLACNFKKGVWSPEEDQILWSLIEAHKADDSDGWDKEAAKILNRTPKQCRERWENAMNPNLCNDEFTKEEDEAIISLHAKLGNQWKKIAAFLNGRTGNRVKSRFQSLQKKPKIFHETGQVAMTI